MAHCVYTTQGVFQCSENDSERFGTEVDTFVGDGCPPGMTYTQKYAASNNANVRLVDGCAPTNNVACPSNSAPFKIYRGTVVSLEGCSTTPQCPSGMHLMGLGDTSLCVFTSTRPRTPDPALKPPLKTLNPKDPKP